MDAPRLHLLGSPRLELPGAQAIPLGPKLAPLVALVVLAGPLDRAKAAAWLYPQLDAAAARTNLRQLLHGQRELLGHVLVAEGRGPIGAVAGLWVDALARVDEGEPGVAEAPLLGEQQFAALPEFQAWLSVERERRRQQRFEWRLGLITGHEASGQWPAGLALAQQLVLEQPLSEQVHRVLMRLHYLRGDRAAALAAFDACEQQLKHELGTGPCQETLDLLAQVEAQSDALVITHRKVPPSVLRPPRLIGRDAEWAQLESCWARDQVMILTGEGGLGKSRLLGDFAQAQGLAQGAVLVVAARPGDERLPYALVSRCLRQLLSRPGLVLPEGVKRELARVLPELGEVPPASDGTRFVNAVHKVLESAAANGLQGMLIDDLYLADAASAEWLQQACASPGLRWVVATRTAELPAQVQGLLAALLEAGQAVQMNLGPLSEAQVAELLASLALPGFDAARWAPQLHRRSGGNPMYLLECVKTLWADGASPEAGAAGGLVALPNVQLLIVQRLHRLSPQALRLARCAAVAGLDFSAALAASVLQVRPLDLSDAWAELEAGQVMRDSAFAHDLIYEAALASVPAPIARELHLEVAQWLQAHSGGPWRIASHWLDGGSPLQAVPHLLRAADLAAAQFRYDEAGQHGVRAAQILQAAGQPGAAFDAYFKAVNHLTNLPDQRHWAHHVPVMEALAASDTQRAYLGVLQAGIALEGAQFEVAERTIAEAIDLARRAGNAEAEAHLEWLRVGVFWERRNLLQALERAERAMALIRQLEPESCRLDSVSIMKALLSGSSLILAALGRFAESGQRALEGYEYSTKDGQLETLNIETRVNDIRMLIDADLARGHLSQARQWVGRWLLLGDDVGIHVRGAFADSIVDLATGAWQEALDRLLQVQQRLEIEPDRYAPMMLVRLARLLGLLGRRDLALKTLRGLAAQDNHSAVHGLMTDIHLAWLGEPADHEHLLEQVAALDDLVLRANMLLDLPAFPSASPTLLQLLSLSAQIMARGGAEGYVLSLQARHAARLVEAGRAGDAANLARRTWALSETGLSPCRVPFAEFAADLASALVPTDAAQAAQIIQRGQAWLEAAAGTLQPLWRETCASRGPLQQRLAKLRHAIGQPQTALGSPGRPA